MTDILLYKPFVERHLDIKTKIGDEWQGLCPYHQDHSPSFSVNVKKGLFICYACGAKGNMKQLAEHLGVPTDPTREPEVSTSDVKAKIAAMQSPKVEITKTVEVERWRIGDYRTPWGTRGIVSDFVFDMFGLGYDWEADALIIPVYSWDGKASAVIRRRMNPAPEQPKYLYPAGFKISENLFGVWQARTIAGIGRIRKMAVVEGSIDALSMWEVGIPAVALLGARMSPAHKRLLEKLDPVEVVVMTDNDNAGRTAALDVHVKLKHTGIIVSDPVSWPRHCKDPSDMTLDERKNAFGIKP